MMISRRRLCAAVCCVFIWLTLAAAGQDAQSGEAETLVSALTGKFPPFSYYDEKGELTGFDVDVSREIARRAGMQSRIVTTEWDGILAGLLAGKYDAIIGSMAITEERKKQVLFSEPYYHSGAQLFIHRDNPHRIYNIDECNGLAVATVLGETYQRYLETHHPEIKVVTLKSTAEMFKLLEQQRISGFVTDRLVGAWQIKKAQRPFVPVGEMLYREEIAIPVRPDERDLLVAINRALADMQSEGVLSNIRNKYFGLGGAGASGEAQAMSTGVVANKLLRGFGLTLLIAFLSIATGFVLSVPCGLLLNKKSGPWKIPSFLVRTIVDFLRGAPVLIQLLFVWMALGFTPVVAAVFTLGINAMAYMAEVVRAGLMSVDPGQARAARALGLSRQQTFFHVIWPQAFRIAMPPLMNSVVALIKDTALVAVISVPEVIREAQSIISVTFEPGKYYFIVALMFFIVTFPLMKFASRLEARIKEKGFAA